MNERPADVHILAIDDNIEFLNLIRATFDLHNYHIQTAFNGLAVQKIVAKEEAERPFDLIILDMMLPGGMNGLDIFNWLRSQPKTADTPIIVLSGIATIDQRVEMMNLGADDYITKPFPVNDLQARAAVHIQLGRLRWQKKKFEQQALTQELQLNAIEEIGRGVVQKLELMPMLEEAVQSLTRYFACDFLGIYLTDPAGDNPTPVAWAGKLAFDDEQLANLIHQSFESGRPLTLPHKMAEPIYNNEKVLGVLALVDSTGQLSNRNTGRALKILASQIAIALTNIYLFQDLEQRNRQLADSLAENDRLLKMEQKHRLQAEKLYQISELITTSLDLNIVLDMAMSGLQNMIQVELGSIFLLDDKTKTLTFANVFNQETDYLRDARFPADKGVVGYVVTHGKPLVVNQAQQHPLFFPEIDRITGRVTRSLLCVPLIARDRVVGAVELLNKIGGPFTDDDLALVASISSTFAFALDNARLYQEQTKLIQEVQLSQEQLVRSEKLAATGRLAASLAHEINNPLQAIHSCLQLAINFNLNPDRQAEYLGMANEEVERLAQIMNRIMEFVRPPGAAIQPANINKIISQVMLLTEKYITHNQCHIEQQLASDLPLVWAVSDQLAQTFLHLILNAFDAMPGGGLLLIQTRLAGDWVEIVFQDNGIGMPPDVLGRIFEPFYSTRMKAHGLGLPISHTIVEQHGGHIRAESQVNQGTTITVSLPKVPDVEMGQENSDLDL